MTLRQIGAVVVCALVCALSLSAAEATQRQKAPRASAGALIHCADGSYRSVCPVAAARTTAGRFQSETRAEAIIVGGRPSGCPYRYCGCAVSLKVFGRMVDGLNLAANWKHRFPRAAPGPGMVAARNGHVFVIDSMIDTDTALAWDPNSGGGKTRIHPRPLRGYTVVDPTGSKVASQ